MIFRRLSEPRNARATSHARCQDAYGFLATRFRFDATIVAPFRLQRSRRHQRFHSLVCDLHNQAAPLRGARRTGLGSGACSFCKRAPWLEGRRCRSRNDGHRMNACTAQLRKRQQRARSRRRSLRRSWPPTRATPSATVDDPWTARAVARFREHFGDATDVFFTFNGTGANVVALSCLSSPWDAVLCPASAHLQTDECGAFERFTGSKVIPIATADGKLRVADIEPYLLGGHGEHLLAAAHHLGLAIDRVRRRLRADELRELCEFAHDRGLLVHVDGARIANAAAALGTTPRAITKDSASTSLASAGRRTG